MQRTRTLGLVARRRIYRGLVVSALSAQNP